MTPSSLARTAGLAGTTAILLGLAALPLLAWPLPVASCGAGLLLICLAAPLVAGPGD